MKPEILQVGDLIGIAFCYVLLTWPQHLLLAGIGTVGAVVTRFVNKRLFIPVLKASWLFALYLLACGLTFNGIWNITVFDRLYWSYDYAGYECSPFGLLICGTVEAPAQFFHGATENTIHWLWLIYAAASWGFAALLTWRQLRGKEVSVEPAGGAYFDPAAGSKSAHP